MIKKFVVGIFVLLILVTQARAVVVNFDDLIGQAPVPEGYGGINWGGVWTYYGWEQYPYTPHSYPNRIYTPYTENNLGGEYQFTFVNPNQIFNGAWFSGETKITELINGIETEISPTVQFRLYNDGNLVYSSIVLFMNDIPTFLPSGYAGTVDVVGVYSNANDFYVMDDVTYGNNPVPEPTTMFLLGSGLIGVLGLRRKFRK